MSQTALKLSTAPRKLPRQLPTRAPLRVVAGGYGIRQLWFGVAMLLVLVAGLLGVLMLNTALAEGSYQRSALVSESNELTDRQEMLTHELDGLRAPATLAKKASALGMVPAQSPAFIRLADGRVLGVAEAASSKNRFTVITAPTLPSTTDKSTKGATTTKKKG